jgi:hypothetical protein
MFDLNELIKAIDTLQIAEKDDALNKPDGKISDLKKASYDMCAYIHAQILNHYPTAQRDKFPTFDPLFTDSRPFNMALLSWYKSHACYLAYLVNKNNPLERAKLNIYLTMAEQNGFPFVRVVEFYKDHCGKITQASTLDQLNRCYINSRASIKHQFTLDTPKGRFLDLLMMIQIVNAAQKSESNDCRSLVNNFHQKIDAALKLFEKKLEDNIAAADFNQFFETGTMHPYYSSNAFISYVKAILENTNPDRQYSSNKSASMNFSTQQRK